MNCLKSTIAGSWYPGDAAELRRMLDGFAAKIPPVPENSPVPNILILPHAGYQYSAPTALYGIRRIMGAKFNRVVVLAPSHCCGFRDRLIAPDCLTLKTPLGELAVDGAALREIAAEFPVDRNNAVHANEHAAQIEFPLLQYALKDFKVVPLIVSEMTETGFRQAASALRRVLDENTLLVVSSDFTHYGARFDFTPFEGKENIAAEVQKLDHAAFDAIRARDIPRCRELLEKTGATICGRTPILLLMHLIPAEARFEMLHYTNSMAANGNATDFVCYLCAAGYAVWPPTPTKAAESAAVQIFTEAEKKSLLSMARRAIEHTLSTHRSLPLDTFAADVTESMRKPMGCFVTLTDSCSGNLRGCIGEIKPSRPLYQAVIARAVDAAFRDPRFPMLNSWEWPGIRIEISALTPLRPVDSWRDIVIGKHGMTISKHGHTAVFLPQVAPEQHWDLPTTLTQLALKAGLGPNDWRDGAKFFVFEAVVFHECESKDTCSCR